MKFRSLDIYRTIKTTAITITKKNSKETSPFVALGGKVEGNGGKWLMD